MRSLPFLLIAGLALLFLMPEAVSESGGPDSFGYTFKDSNETDGPTYNWIDISSNGTTFNLTGDGSSGPYDIGFDFFFYGSWYNQWWLGGDNGYINLGGGIGNLWTPQSIPTTQFSDRATIAPFWNDLRSCTGDNSTLSYKNFGNDNNRTLVLQYNNLRDWNSCDAEEYGLYNFEIILFERTGDIVFQYNNDFSNGETSKTVSIGIQGSYFLSEGGVQYYYGNIMSLEGAQFSVRFYAPPIPQHELLISDLEYDYDFSYSRNETIVAVIRNMGTENQTDFNLSFKILYDDGTVLHNHTKNIDFIERYASTLRVKLVAPIIMDFDVEIGKNITIDVSLVISDENMSNNEIRGEAKILYMFFKETFEEGAWNNSEWDFSESSVLHDGSQAWNYSTDVNGNSSMFSGYRCSQGLGYSSVTSPSFDLSIGKNVWMKFSHSYYFYYTYDGAHLQISTGSGFTTIVPEGGYPATIYNYAYYGNPIRGTQGWTFYANDGGGHTTTWQHGTNPTEVIFDLSAYAGYSDVKLRWSVGFSSISCGSSGEGGYGFDNLIIYEDGNIPKHDLVVNDIEGDYLHSLNYEIDEDWYYVNGLTYSSDGNISVNLKNYGIHDIYMNDVICNIEIRQLHEEGNTTLTFEEHQTCTGETLNSGSETDVRFHYNLDSAGDYEFLIWVEYEEDEEEANNLQFFVGRLLYLILEEGTVNGDNWDGWVPLCGSFRCEEQEIENGTTWSVINDNSIGSFLTTGADVIREPGSDEDDYSIVSPAFDFSNSVNTHIFIEHTYNFYHADGGRIEICYFPSLNNCSPITAIEGNGYDGYVGEYESGSSFHGNPLSGKEAFVNSNSGISIINIDELQIPGPYKNEVYFKFRKGGNYVYAEPHYWTIHNFKVFSKGPQIKGNFLELPDSVYLAEDFSFSANYTNTGTENIDFGYVHASFYNADREIYYNSYLPISNLETESSANFVFNFPYSLNPGPGDYQIYVHLVSLFVASDESTDNVESCAPSEFTSSPNNLYIHHPYRDDYSFYCAGKIILLGDIIQQDNILEANLRIDSKKPTINIAEESKALLEESNYTFIEGQENEIIIITNDPDGYVDYITLATDQTRELWGELIESSWKFDCYQNCTGEGTTPIYLHELQHGLHLITIYGTDNSNYESAWIQFNVTILADSDRDGVINGEDVFPYESTQTSDRDSDGYGDNKYGYQGDVFPDDSTEWYDSDSDGMGDNADECPTETNGFVDEDGDGFCERYDMCPEDSLDWRDADGDGVCDNSDVFPTNKKEWIDTDNDGYGDNGDAFPRDMKEWSDLDGDGIGDNSDILPENRFFHSTWHFPAFAIMFGITAFSINHGYRLFTLSTRVDNRMNDVRKRIAELEEKGVNTDELKKVLEEAEKNLEKWILN